ncbi:MAG: hypothetical protein ABTS16_12815 [Candidatus Accumulibacter phosphatis]|uniref:hypothetical protein n=1 Tax=Candidatus Accumulibacter TaxID=327159 RepID=UPI0004B529AE|nr:MULTISPECIES: hypothetical protein [Candidatus Accumulibacter]HRF11506.1 hypothetical protein [Candidatus Accumulibacter phosphatis]
MSSITGSSLADCSRSMLHYMPFKKQDVDAWVRAGGAAASSDDFENREGSSG